jgi:hypothetical protein
MKNTLKSILKVFLIVFLILYLGLEILVTVCLLNFNDYGITEIGKTSWVIADEDFSEGYEKGDLLIVKKGTGEEVSIGDYIFFYNPSENNVINYAEVSNIVDTNGYYTYIVGNDYHVYYDYYVGEDVKQFKNVGSVLSVLESQMGFLVLIILPTIVAIIFEIYAIIIEVVELKKEV